METHKAALRFEKARSMQGAAISIYIAENNHLLYFPFV